MSLYRVNKWTFYVFLFLLLAHVHKPRSFYCFFHFSIFLAYFCHFIRSFYFFIFHKHLKTKWFLKDAEVLLDDIKEINEQKAVCVSDKRFFFPLRSKTIRTGVLIGPTADESDFSEVKGLVVRGRSERNRKQRALKLNKSCSLCLNHRTSLV